MRILWGILLLVHGLIHLLGFLKAFRLASANQLTFAVSKTFGIFWLIAAVTFVSTVVLIFLKKESWPLLAFISVVLSQVLIVCYWQEAKFGTFVNVIILLISIPEYGKYQFHQLVKKEKTELLKAVQTSENDLLLQEDIKELPPIVQTWIENSGVLGKTKAVSVRLKQKGELKTTPGGGWMPFAAEQYTDVVSPAFIWTTEVHAPMGVPLVGRDKCKDGKGEMIIKLFSVINVANEKDNEKINTGSMLRFLGEMCWYPSAATHDYLKWEALDSLSARATVSWKGTEVSGVFRFTNEGQIISFEALRYYGSGADATQHPWKIEVFTFKEFEGIRVPDSCQLTWKLPEGDFLWLQLSLTHLEYNKTPMFY